MSVSAESVPVEVTLRGHVGSHARDYARDKVAAALVGERPSRLHAHVVLERRADPAVTRSNRAEVTADVGGAVLRAHAVAASMGEAVDEMESRLRRQLVQLRDRTRTRHRWTGIAGEHEWRHGDLPREAEPWFPRPAESREVLRRKTFAAEPMTVDEAAWEMDLLDHDFYLYTDLASGEPALVRRLPEGGYAVRGGAEQDAVAEVTREPAPPTLTDGEARTRMDADGEPFVFYVDAAGGGGRVLYRRYDGHYGLIEAGG
ncbi:ribosome hibernation promotion factor [Nocardioides ungokensis]|uniref:ribosome hibernation promotion factor n=1 Tax=Nocardioides ungokensis TaxID=1643322 RepID=UPI0015DE610A|nr:HPF/RaiA family ribosome-associated protein [Nocardioides ungokensis]